MNWTRLKQKNRLHRHDLRGLDSKLRTQMRSRRQTRFAGGLAVLAVAAGLLGAGLWLGIRNGMRHMFSENVHFQIQEIVVRSSGEVLKPERVLADLQVQRGQNLLAVNLEDLRRELELRPVVERAEVSRELPGRLIIQITERVPVAGITTQPGGPCYQIDRQGIVMDLASHQKNSEEFCKRLNALPRITGAEIADLKIGRAGASPGVFHALALLQRADQLDLGSALEINTVDISRRGMLFVNTAEGTLVKMNVADMDRQLRRLATILGDARQRSLKVSTVDLTVGRDVPVTFASAQ